MRRKWGLDLTGLKTVAFGGGGVGVGGEKLKMSSVSSRAKMKLWMIRATSSILLWTCVVQLITLGETWGPRVLNNWPPCFHHDSAGALQVQSDQKVPVPVLPPKRVYKNNGYLMVSCNGGLNQMRSAICDMVAIARYLNVTLIVPELDKTSFWSDPSSDFERITSSAQDEGGTWADSFNATNKLILPLIRKYKVVHLNRTDSRLANNGQPLEIQKLRCRVNFFALKFTPQIEELGRKVINLLRKNGPFMVLHLRYEMDMLAFSGCTQGFNNEEVEELTRMRYDSTGCMPVITILLAIHDISVCCPLSNLLLHPRYAYPWWKEKVIDSDLKRKDGLCPLTPEETALTLKALEIDQNIQVYIAAGDIYGGHRRMATLAAAYPNLVRKETLLEHADLQFFQNHSSQMAALDYLVSLESDIFVPTYDGNMAKVVEGHRRQLGYKKTIILDRKLLVELIDQFNSESMTWDEFSAAVKEAHSERMGNPTKRLMIPDRPKEEDYFYSNPWECFQQPKEDEAVE
ncbi:hypothetical protein Leryth_023877 [Lithospermum erythrorhizon]|nr:hypothetical protein Leryth_023877 [Lithospermum erythrorhizon]